MSPLFAGLTGFDYVALVIVGVSAASGFLRGATREIVGAVSFVGAVAAAAAGARYVAPLLGTRLGPPWLVHVIAIAIVFVLAYLVLAGFGGLIVGRVRNSMLSTPDRALGLVFGLARGVVAIGVVALVVEATAPVGTAPRWILAAKSFPVARATGDELRAIAPRSFRFDDILGSAFAGGGRDLGSYGAARPHSLAVVVEDPR